MKEIVSNNSKDLWLQLEKNIPNQSFQFGPYSTQAYFDDPACMAFITSRYKFCAKMLSGLKTVLEIGCGDGFGGAIVAQKTDKLICTDINEAILRDNEKRMGHFSNIEYHYHDFREKPYQEKVNGIFLVDVIEHIFPSEETNFLENLSNSLSDNGICLIGTPNLSSEKYASKYSKIGHVNLKDHMSLKSIGEKYFKNSFLFGMNDEIVHTGFSQMCHYLWALCVDSKKN
jgi:cyclopropane fatty-acyl-phospholipid synthase-like methyltransferase